MSDKILEGRLRRSNYNDNNVLEFLKLLKQ